MLPWLQSDRFPLYLAPMAGVTDVIFRGLCKELGADVMVTEFVSAEGILKADERTRRYTEFEDFHRPVGVQLFGADGRRMGEAARKIIAWKQPDFIDINFGCPVNKVISKNGGSSLLRDCPMLADVARGVAEAVRDLNVPVTAKMRIGWDAKSINAPDVVRLLEDAGMAAIAIHGRTRAQGYSGQADWDVIARCAEIASVPIIGNGDIQCGADVERIRRTTKVRGVMIGRAAMVNPWIFQEAKHFLQSGVQPAPATTEQRFDFMRRHVRLAVESGRYGPEQHAMRAMRSRLMNYTKSVSGGKWLRMKFSTVGTVAEFEQALADYDVHGRHERAHPAGECDAQSTNLMTA